MSERLQKVLAAAGWGSRRACEELILSGRVRVNNRWVNTLPVLVDPEADEIFVDNRPVRSERKVYYILNKPKGVFCTQNDPAGRTRAADLLRGVRERVYPVGRLDADSRGLLLMTNDGELAAVLTHPRYGVPKTYRAWTSGRIPSADIERLQQGIWLSAGKTRPARVQLIHTSADRSVLEITLHEGRNRQVRRMLAKLGHPVRELTRIRIGPLSLRGLGPGQFRALGRTEVEALRRQAARAARRAVAPDRDAAGTIGKRERRKRRRPRRQ